MLKKTVVHTTGIAIVERYTKIIGIERTCDICGKPISGSFWKMYYNTLENPKHDGCIDICSNCYHNGAYADGYPQNKFSEIAFKKFIDPRKEVETDPEYSYGCSWFDDDPKTEYVDENNNEAVTNFIDFVRKTAKSLDILEERKHVRYGY